MNFIADLHIHSRFSLATSRQLNVAHLSQWAARKGIDVLGTGDFTHPKWREELRQSLAYDEESGLYKPAPEILPDMRDAPFFCLQAEISCIYKKNGKTRKVHNLLYAPNLEAADAISRRLAQVGNIASDGRPILGLDSRDLLEIALECSSQCVLVPAHVWTPWFALFGSKSGFDSLEECYGDLSDHIFALETGLSSDPPMNRCLSALDKYALISNSDAHSGANLGREANMFAGAPSYEGMFSALKSAARREDQSGNACVFLGTMEFYPEEGKYHLDGHRACNVAMTPKEAREAGNICPVCGRPLTIGVLHRVMELADREQPGDLEREPEARMLVPLAEVIGQIMRFGTATRKVQEKYLETLEKLGPELDILCNLPEEKVRGFWEPLGEAVARIRAGKVGLDPGFDGRYGIIRIFDDQELADINQGKSGRLPGLKTSSKKAIAQAGTRKLSLFKREDKLATEKPLASPDQLRAVNAGPGPVFVLAGPGSGKTRTLVLRIEKLLAAGEDPRHILALTFTRRAAGEMRDRLSTAKSAMPDCDTLHGLAWELMRANFAGTGKQLFLLDENAAFNLFCAANNNLENPQKNSLWKEIALAREKNIAPSGELAAALARYANAKSNRPDLIYVDYADLLQWLNDNAGQINGRWTHLLVDEAQDLSPVQLEITRKLLPEDGNGFFGIGDPDQSIYEFRGASGDSLGALRSFWPNLHVIRLSESYRASQKILTMAHDLLGADSICGQLHAAQDIYADLRLFTAANEYQEADWLSGKIKSLLGPTSHTLKDASAREENCSPGDIAILCRLKAQFPPIMAALQKNGIPFSAPAEADFWADSQCAAFLDLALRQQPDEPPKEFLAKLMSHGEFVGEFFAQSENFSRLRALWKECGDWEKFFGRLAWFREAEMISAKASKVQLLTLHASKGLEFEIVFLPGLEDGLMPLKRDLLFLSHENDLNENMASEKRLLYVGLTRAAREIYLSRCKKRRLYGRDLALDPSPWLGAVAKYCRKSIGSRHVARKEEFLSLFDNGKQN